MKTMQSKIMQQLGLVVALLALPLPAAKAAIILINSPANDVLAGYEDGGYLKNGLESVEPFVGNLAANAGHARTLIKYDLSSVLPTVTSASLNMKILYIGGTVLTQEIKLTSYNVDVGASAFTGTDIVNSMGSSTYLASTTVSSGTEGGVNIPWTIDVTATVQAAKTLGWSYVSFMLYDQTANELTTTRAFVYFNGPVVDTPPLSLDVTSVPEPAFLALAGLAGVTLLRRRRD